MTDTVLMNSSKSAASFLDLLFESLNLPFWKEELEDTYAYTLRPTNGNQVTFWVSKQGNDFEYTSVHEGRLLDTQEFESFSDVEEYVKKHEPVLA